MIFKDAESLEVTLDHFYEENIICTETSSTATVMNVTDVTDFDFLANHDYLIISTATWGHTTTADPVIMNVKHGTTIFEGSQQNEEVSDAEGDACSGGLSDDVLNYFWWTIYTPNATEATEDITLNLDATGGSTIFADDVTMTIIDLNNMTQNQDWFFDEQKTDSPLGLSFDTANNATLVFTPQQNNTDWLILGTSLLDVDSAVVQYMTRLFVNGTETDFPVISREGEDTTEQILQTFARVLTLTNSSQRLEVQSQLDASAGGTNERLYNSIFALNLNLTKNHSFIWNQTEIDFDNTEFGTEIANINITPNESGDLFILADIGFQDSTKLEVRVQLNNTDTVPEQTSKSFDFIEEYDTTDIGRWGMASIEPVTNITQSIDVDASEVSAGDDIEALYRSLVAFVFVAEITDISSNVFDSMTLNDTNSHIFVGTRNQTDNMNMTDTNTFIIAFQNNQTDNMNMTDTNSFIIDTILNQTDIINMTDTSSFIFEKTVNGTANKITFLDSASFVKDVETIVIIDTGGGGVGAGGGALPPTIPDSDGDGILDPEDACPLEPEDFDGFEDADGCPEGIVIEPLERLLIPDIVDLIPFEFNELDVIDDYIELEVDLPQPQVEDLAVRWLGAEQITITSIDIGLSPFEIQVQDIPITFGNNRFGYTETQLLYTVQPPDKICGNVFTFDCLDQVTYKISSSEKLKLCNSTHFKKICFCRCYIKFQISKSVIFYVLCSRSKFKYV